VSSGWPLILASKSFLETGEPLDETRRWPKGGKVKVRAAESVVCNPPGIMTLMICSVRFYTGLRSLSA
jgi:hypothetical protein